MSLNILTVSHSYPVALNRRLAQEMARQGRGRWSVTLVSPVFIHGDLRPIRFEPDPADGVLNVETVNLRTSRRIHFATYGTRLRGVLSRPWDIVHAWEEPFILAGWQLALWASRQARLVYASFQNIDKRYPPPFSCMEAYSLNRAAGWIPFGETVRRNLENRPHYRDKPSRRIPLGVDVEHFSPSEAAREKVLDHLNWSSASIPVVGYLGRFIPEKGLPLLQTVLDRISSPWRLLLVGGGPYQPELERWAARYGDRVRIVNGVKHDGVPDYLNAMDLLVAPSRTTPHWREQLGRMLLEAFACGVPVVGSDSGEIPFVIGDAGLVVGESDEQGWQAAIELLLGDPDRRKELAHRGRERAVSEFAWPVIARRHLDFFESLL